MKVIEDIRKLTVSAGRLIVLLCRFLWLRSWGGRRDRRREFDWRIKVLLFVIGRNHDSSLVVRRSFLIFLPPRNS